MNILKKFMLLLISNAMLAIKAIRGAAHVFYTVALRIYHLSILSLLYLKANL